MLRVGAITNLCIEALVGDTAVLWSALFISVWKVISIISFLCPKYGGI